VEPDPGCCRNRLALVDEAVHELSEIRRIRLLREVWVVRQPGEGGDGIHSCVEDELRPLRRAEIR
jgi:hypothetical protein